MNLWKRVPWVNLWMMAFGGAGIWVIADTFFSTDSIYPYGGTVVIAIVVLGGVGLVGFVRLPLSFFSESSQKGLTNLSHIAGVYVNAWKGVWRRKWILVLFGLIAALNLTGDLTEATLTRHFFAARAHEMGHSNSTPLEHLPLILSGSLPGAIVSVLKWFFPRSCLDTDAGVTVILILPWLYLRLGRLRSDEEYARGARFLQVTSCRVALWHWQYR